MNNAKVYEQAMTIPTYGVGKENKNPMFFEKRVYQGSSGKVYPYPVIDKICDDKKDKDYNVVILENEWLYVVVMPQLGGRIYTAYDKTNGYDFVYHNKVIKPALVGLLGPWISGGIEFNWPQHHRPTTYMAVNYRTQSNPDGSASVFVGETEAMSGLRHTTEIKLYADKSYIEINTDVYNGGEMTKTFLWWANPAYKVNDDTITIMPEDVTAVMDHGKRAVSAFPIAHGEYYKMDYSKGVDISRYSNIPVPTSFMAHRSDYDFVGGYDYSKKAGLLHVADHHLSPGKKQWTWGCGDFGQAWDRNLTDGDGPYVELMTGCFTDNQPDFTFIQPHETKSFTQYFMPYHNVGRVANADKNICFGRENGELVIYSSAYIDARVLVESEGKVLLDERKTFSPTMTESICNVPDKITVTVTYSDKVLRFSSDDVKPSELPEPASACPAPEECITNEELYLFGTHIEQYRHATRLPEDYYLEGLRRDPSDIRLNNAYGMLLMSRGSVVESIPYFDKAIEKSIIKNPNPKDTECYYNAGIAYMLTGDMNKAYDRLYKCLWGNDKTRAHYYLAVILLRQGRISEAIEHAKKAVEFQNLDTRALNTLGRLYKDKGESAAAEDAFLKAMSVDALDVSSRYELGDTTSLKNVSAAEIRIIAGYYLTEGRYTQAKQLLETWKEESGNNESMIEIYLAYLAAKSGESMDEYLLRTRTLMNDKISFANSLTDMSVLEYMSGYDFYSAYQLGNLYYDKRNYAKAAECWKTAEAFNPDFPTVKRNFALYYYNKQRDAAKALEYMYKAFEGDKTDSRVLLELYELLKLCGKSKDELYRLLEDNLELVEERDDLYTEYLSLLEFRGEAEKAYSLLMNRQFHPYEGGEGKITKVYKRINCSLAEKAYKNGDYSQAKSLYERCFSFPHNLGEGKLILDYDNDVCYMLGELSQKCGNDVDAKKYFNMAIRGKIEVCEDMYYNDNPIDYVYYAALAYKKLGMTELADKIKEDMLRYYHSHYGKKQVIDYFAVSLPDMVIWERDIDKDNDEFCLRIKAMAESL